VSTAFLIIKLKYTFPGKFLSFLPNNYFAANMSKTGQQLLSSRRTLARAFMANPAASAPSAPSAPTRPPDESDVTGDLQYDLLAIRGQGPRAKVYKAKEKITGKLLAIKVWYSMEDPEEELKRRDEAKLEGELLAKTRGIVSVSTRDYCKENLFSIHAC
jgi:hypothetical protein